MRRIKPKVILTFMIGYAFAATVIAMSISANLYINYVNEYEQRIPLDHKACSVIVEPTKIETVYIEQEVTRWVAAEQLYNIPALLLEAIERHETGNFSSNLYTAKNNTYGGKCGDHWCEYKTVEESTAALARTLRYRYFDKGLTTLEDIQPIYAPDSPHWITEVNAIMQSIKEGKYAQ